MTITMDRGDFCELVSRSRLVEILTLEAAAKIGPAEARKRELVDRLAKQYGFDASQTWRFDEDAYTLTLVE